MPNFGEKTVVEKSRLNEDEVDTSWVELAEKGSVGNKEREVEGQRVSPEQLRTNLEMLESNIAKMGQIPEQVLLSKEGQEATQSLTENMAGKLASFCQGLVDKLATLDSWKGKDRMVKVLSGVAGAAILGPLVLQMARTKWPEVGVALDAAPDALQQFIHLDVWARIADALGYGNELKDGSIWKNAGVDVNNILADISSGKETVTALAADKMQLLKDSMDAEELRVLTSPSLRDPARYAEALSGGTTMARTVFGNSSLIAASGLGLYSAMTKIGSLANKIKK